MISQLETLRKIEVEQYLFTSYENIYRNSKLVIILLKYKFLNDLLHEFIKKADIFHHSSSIDSKNINEEIIVNKKKYLALKNSYIK